MRPESDAAGMRKSGRRRFPAALKKRFGFEKMGSDYERENERGADTGGEGRLRGHYRRYQHGASAADEAGRGGDERPTGRLKENDVSLYRRGEDYVLHRVVRVLPDSYEMRGDNCLRREQGITDGEILGVLTGFYRKGGRYCSVKDPRYRLYVRCVRLLYPLRRAYLYGRSTAAGIWHRLKG